jgi:hypothetical protein
MLAKYWGADKRRANKVTTMSQRNSEYARKERDRYITPGWCVHTLVPHLCRPTRVWEPAAGNGAMAAGLRECGLKVVESDIDAGVDFLAETNARGANCICTNPPYTCAQQFIEHALVLMSPCRGIVAMLLRTDFDHAKTRRHLFGAPFARKLVLTKRIVWFKRMDGKKEAPSENHAFFIWDWQHIGPPILVYGP